MIAQPIGPPLARSTHDHLVALVSGFGWHVEDLRRAARSLDIEFEAVPFAEVSASLGEGAQKVVAGGVELTGSTACWCG